MWSVSTIITGLISFMVESQPTLGSIESSNDQKKTFARHSLAYNVKHEQFQKLFPELVKKHEEIMQERIELLGENRVLREGEEYRLMNGTSETKEKEEVHFLAVMAGFVALVSILFAMRFL